MNAKLFDKVFRSIFILVFVLSMVAVPTQNVRAEEPNPGIVARPDDEKLMGDNWPRDLPVTITIDDPRNGTGVDYTDTLIPGDLMEDPSDTGFDFVLSSFNLRPGDLVTFDNGQTTKSHTVMDLTVTSIDLENDTLSGTADPGAEVLVWINPYSPERSRRTTADSNGLWFVNFHIPGDNPEELDTVDITPETRGYIKASDEDGDCTQIGWPESNSPLIFIQYHSTPAFSVIDWLPETIAQITILDPSGLAKFDGQLAPTETDECGFWPPFHCAHYHLPDNVTLEPLDTLITAADGQVTIHHVVGEVKVTYVNIETDTIYGTVNPPHDWPEHFYALFFDTECNGTGEYHTTFDEFGNWSWNVSEVCDLTEDSWGPIHYNPEYTLGDDYYAGWQLSSWHASQVLNPVLSVRLDDNSIFGYDWPYDTDITLTIDDPATTDIPVDYSATRQKERTPWGEILAWFDLNGFYEVKPGDQVTLQGGGYTRTHTVFDGLSVTSVNADDETVSGTALDGASIVVNSCNEAGVPYRYCTYRYIDGVTGGAWTIDFSVQGTRPDEKILMDLRPGMDGEVRQFDEDGDSTVRIWDLRNPYFGVRGNDRGKPYYVEGREWPMGATVTIEIDDPMTENSPDYTGTANVGTDPWDPNKTWFETQVQGYETKAGDLVTVSYGSVTKHHTVMNFMITEIDLDTDTIYGIATPGQRVEVWTSRPGLPNAVREVFADENGDWFVNFAIPGDQDWELDTADLRPGSWVDSVARDEDGDGTMYGWSVPNPVISAVPAWNQVDGYGWPMGASVHLTIDDDADPINGVLYDDTKTVEIMNWEWNHTDITFYLWEDDFTLQAGQYITMTDGDTIKTHWVTSLSVTTIDLVADTVSGTAEPGSIVHHSAYDENGSANRHVIADENGDWIADFAHVGEGDDEQDLLDIRSGVGDDVFQMDEDGDYTEVRWRVPNPPNVDFCVWLDSNRVHGYEWPLGDIVTLTVDDPSTTQSPDYTTTDTSHPAPWNPDTTAVEYDLTGILTLAPGFQVTMNDASFSLTLTVVDIQISNVDTLTDTISGVTVPDTVVSVDIHNAPGIGRNVVANGSGEWTADFSTPGDEDWENNTYDIVPGTSGNTVARGANGAGSGRSWRVPNPNFRVRPNFDDVEGWEWEVGQWVTLTIGDPDNGGYSGTRQVSQAPWNPSESYVVFNLGGVYDIQPGDVASLSNGTVTKTTTVTNLAITDINVDTNVVTGVAAAGSSVDVWTCDEFGCYNPDPNPVANENGIWTYDFTGIYDIVPGTWIDSSEYDEDGDSTTFGQNVPDYGNIAGLVHDSQGNSIPDAKVCAYGYDSNWLEKCESSDSGGLYTIADLHAGDYRIAVIVNGWLDEYYDNTLDWSAAARVPVTAYETISGIDFILEPSTREVTVWYTLGSGDPNEIALMQVISNAEAADPGLDIVPEYHPDPEEYRTAVQSGGGPDIYFGGNDSTRYAHWGIVLNIDSYVQGMLSNIVPMAIDGFTVDGELFGVPVSGGVEALYYNKALLAIPPSNTSELLSLQQSGQTLAGRGIDSGGWLFYGLWNAFGGQILDANGLCVADQGGVVDALQYLLDLQASGAFLQADYGAAQDAFLSGNASMLINGPWALPQYRAALGDDLGVVPLPDGPVGSAMPLSGLIGFFINPNAGDPAGLVDLTLYMTNPPNEQIWVDVGSQLPIRSDITISDPLVAAFVRAWSQGDSETARLLSSYWVPFNNMIADVLTGAIAPEAGVARACMEMNSQLPDGDNDDIPDVIDNAPTVFNPDQRDVDGDGVADVLDPCPADETDTCNQQGSTSAAIGSEGGTLTTANSKVSIQVPSGALAEPISLSITDGGSGYTVETDQGQIETVVAVDIEPSGTTFATPITITFQWQDANNDGRVDGTSLKESKLVISKDGVVIAGPCGSDQNCNMAANTFAVQVSSLSFFVLGAPPNLPPVAEAGPSQTIFFGNTVTLNASASSDSDGDLLTFEWDLDNDGQYDDANGVTIVTSIHQVGVHTIGLRVTDDGGLSDTDTTTVTVLPWTLKGFYQPVDMNGVYNLVKGGSTVPLKFEVFAGTTELTDVSYIKSLTYSQTACDATAITDEIETIATGNTSLRYDWSSGEFIYNWKTPKSAGKCYRVTMTTIDGSSLLAYFKLK